MITARLLTPEQFGIAAAASFFLQLAARLTQFGFNAALVRMNPLKDEHADTAFVLSIGLGVSAWLTLALSAPLIASFFHSPATGQILPIAALSFLAVPLGTVPNALMMRDLRYRELSYCMWINTLTSSATTIVLALLGFGFWSLVFGQLAAAIVQTVAKMWYARWTPRFRFDRDAARDMISFGAGIYTLRLLEYGALNLDSMVVGRTMGMATLGLYDKAFNLMSRVLDRMNQAGPTISFRVFAVIQEEHERFRRAYRKVILSSTLICYPAMTVLAVSAPLLFDVLFGHQWIAAAWPFQILCLAGGLKVLNSYAAAVVEARGRVWSEVWRQALYAALIVVGVTLSSRWGITGAATAVLLSTITVTVLMQRLLLTATPLTLSDVIAPQIPSIICAAAAGAAAWVARALVVQATSNAWISLPVVVGCGSIVFLAFVFLAPSPDVRNLVKQVIEDLWPVVRNALQFNRPQVGTSQVVSDETSKVRP
jgi:PST family polysaccharide transporter